MTARERDRAFGAAGISGRAHGELGWRDRQVVIIPRMKNGAFERERAEQ